MWSCISLFCNENVVTNIKACVFQASSSGAYIQDNQGAFELLVYLEKCHAFSLNDFYSIFFLLPTNPMPKKRPKLTNKALICLSTLYPMNAGTCEASDLSLQESHPLLQVPDDSISLLDDSPGVLQLQSQTNKYKRNSVRCSGRDATDVSNRSRCSITYS